MANPTCTRDSLIDSAACLNGGVLSAQEKLARKVWFQAKQLAAIGGTNYTADIEGLNTAADSLTCGMTPDNLDSSELVIEYNNAVAAGASVNTDKDSLAGDVKCLANYPPNVLRNMSLLLKCKLGRGKAYPQ